MPLLTLFSNTVDTKMIEAEVSAIPISSVSVTITAQSQRRGVLT